jgi:hypothetical protein
MTSCAKGYAPRIPLLGNGNNALSTATSYTLLPAGQTSDHTGCGTCAAGYYSDRTDLATCSPPNGGVYVLIAMIVTTELDVDALMADIYIQIAVQVPFWAGVGACSSSPVRRRSISVYLVLRKAHFPDLLSSTSHHGIVCEHSYRMLTSFLESRECKVVDGKLELQMNCIIPVRGFPKIIIPPGTLDPVTEEPFTLPPSLAPTAFPTSAPTAPTRAPSPRTYSYTSTPTLHPTLTPTLLCNDAAADDDGDKSGTSWEELPLYEYEVWMTMPEAASVSNSISLPGSAIRSPTRTSPNEVGSVEGVEELDSLGIAWDPDFYGHGRFDAGLVHPYGHRGYGAPIAMDDNAEVKSRGHYLYANLPADTFVTLVMYSSAGLGWGGVQWHIAKGTRDTAPGTGTGTGTGTTGNPGRPGYHQACELTGSSAFEGSCRFRTAPPPSHVPTRRPTHTPCPRPSSAPSASVLIPTLMASESSADTHVAAGLQDGSGVIFLEGPGMPTAVPTIAPSLTLGWVDAPLSSVLVLKGLGFAVITAIFTLVCTHVVERCRRQRKVGPPPYLPSFDAVAQALPGMAWTTGSARGMPVFNGQGPRSIGRATIPTKPIIVQPMVHQPVLQPPRRPATWVAGGPEHRALGI